VSRTERERGDGAKSVEKTRLPQRPKLHWLRSYTPSRYVVLKRLARAFFEVRSNGVRCGLLTPPSDGRTLSFSPQGRTLLGQTLMLIFDALRSARIAAAKIHDQKKTRSAVRELRRHTGRMPPKGKRQSAKISGVRSGRNLERLPPAGFCRGRRNPPTTLSANRIG
jgi:hypothetical protein